MDKIRDLEKTGSVNKRSDPGNLRGSKPPIRPCRSRRKEALFSKSEIRNPTKSEIDQCLLTSAPTIKHALGSVRYFLLGLAALIAVAAQGAIPDNDNFATRFLL